MEWNRPISQEQGQTEGGAPPSPKWKSCCVSVFVWKCIMGTIWHSVLWVSLSRSHQSWLSMKKQREWRMCRGKFFSYSWVKQSWGRFSLSSCCHWAIWKFPTQTVTMQPTDLNWGHVDISQAFAQSHPFYTSFTHCHRDSGEKSGGLKPENYLIEDYCIRVWKNIYT